jgi:hypothetical protein
VTVRKDSLLFDYPAKSGVQRTWEIDDASVSRSCGRCVGPARAQGEVRGQGAGHPREGHRDDGPPGALTGSGGLFAIADRDEPLIDAQRVIGDPIP